MAPPDATAPPRRARDLAAAVALVAVYVVAGKLGLKLATVNASATAVWLPTGIALAALLLGGRRLWPAVAAGAFIVNLTTTGRVATSLAIAVGNALEAVVGAGLVERFAGGRRAFARPQGLLLFVVLAAGVAPAVAASVGAATLALGGLAPPPDLGGIWLTWWLGDGIGALIACPVILLWAEPGRDGWTPRRALEATLLAGTVAVVGALEFGPLMAPGADWPFELFCLPLVLWTAFRFDQRFTATVCLAISAIAIAGTLHGRGPFARIERDRSLLMLQAFMGVLTTTGLAVAGVIAESRRLQRETARWSETLAGSNRELEQFAYIASHDLQEPLRMIASFLELLQLRRAQALDEQASGWIQRATEGAQRMSRLINDLLEFSRVGRRREAAGPVAVGEVVAQVVETLAGGAGTRIDFGELPTVVAERFELTQVFQNLVGNALKFRAKDREHRVTVRAERRQDAWEFAVADNGIGIDPAHSGRIFDLFQRLHSREEYPGTGVGLAICKKIVEHHGGSIWVESILGEGATFRFTLPDRAAAEDPSATP